jgi:hypothetical protein
VIESAAELHFPVRTRRINHSNRLDPHRSSFKSHRLETRDPGQPRGNREQNIPGQISDDEHQNSACENVPPAGLCSYAVSSNCIAGEFDSVTEGEHQQILERLSEDRMSSGVNKERV